MRVFAIGVVTVAVACLGCSAGAGSDEERLEAAIRALAESGAPNRLPEHEHVDEVVCEQIRSTPTYDCYVEYGKGIHVAIFPFCAEMRDGTVYINSERGGCGFSFRRATPRNFG